MDAFSKADTACTTFTESSQRDCDSAAHLLGRATAVAETLVAEAGRSDAERRLTERTVHSLVDHGMLRLFTPKRVGGHQARPTTLLDVCRALGQGCCSSAWVTSVLNMGNYMATQFGEDVQDEIWGEYPDASVALVIVASKATIERCDGGMIVTGRWPYGSGSLHADWIAALVPKGVDPADDTTNLILMRADDVRIEDDWRVAGMRGTGSNTVVADQLFIPARHAMSYAPIVRGTSPIAARLPAFYRSSFSGLLSIGLLGPQIGAAEAALAQVRGEAGERRVASSTFKCQAESPAFQTYMAEAALSIDAAYLHARRIGETVESYTELGILPDEVTRSRFRMEAARVTRLCREAVDQLITAYGSSAFVDGNPLQRIWRDIHVASRHAGFGMGIPQLVYGRTLVGLDPREISYLV